MGADREIALAAVRCCGAAMEFVSSELREDFNFALEAIRCSPDAFPHVPIRLRVDEAFLRAVRAGSIPENLESEPVAEMQPAAETEEDPGIRPEGLGSEPAAAVETLEGTRSSPEAVASDAAAESCIGTGSSPQGLEV